MLFNSYLFIFIFFPLCIFGFYLLHNVDNSKWAKVWLIGFSLWFYGVFNVSYLLIMLFSILLNYVLTFCIIRFSDKPRVTRSIFAMGVVANLGVLFYFKYFDFFLSNINAVFGLELPLKGILLPLGISFFTFQQIGFLADVYKGELERIDFIDYALFVSFFPQLIAGPIVNHEEMLPQFAAIKDREPDYEKIGRGLTLFLLGLSKKVLIADTLGRAVDAGYAALEGMNGLECFLIMLWYSLQLYFDFSGYCDMARGLAQMLGFELPVNFNSPYKAAGIIEFWKRWHITLTRFFTRYVYFPLGGSRRGQVRTLINVFIVYLLSGIWHGAGWNYILWGVMHGVLYVLARAYGMYRVSAEKKIMNPSSDQIQTSKLTRKKEAYQGIKHVLGVILTFIYVSFAWVYFRAENIAQGTLLIRRMFTESWMSVSRTLSEAMKPDEFWYVVKLLRLDRFMWSQNLVMIFITLVALLMVFLAPNADHVSKRIKPRFVNAFILAMLGLWCVLSLSQVSTFLYFNF